MQIILGTAACAAFGVVAWRGAQWIAAAARAREAGASAREAAEAVQRQLVTREGGAPDHPIVVTSAAAVEPRVESLSCPFCEHGRPHVVEHTVTTAGDERLREVTTRCGDCGRRTTLYVAVRKPELN